MSKKEGERITGRAKVREESKTEIEKVSARAIVREKFGGG